MEQFTMAFPINYAKIRNKVKRLCILLAISRLFIYYYFFYHEHDYLPWSKTNAIYTSKGVTCITTFTIIFTQ